MALNLYFELGWLGVLSFFSLFFCTIVHLLVQAGRGSIHAASYLAALVGFQMVGLFDSLLDVPRLALLFYLVLLFALMLPARPRTQQLRKSSP
jgi:cbb3-type cytochrome oxidase subunit 3